MYVMSRVRIFVSEGWVLERILPMGVGRGAAVALALPWILKFSAKEGCFLSFEWEKSNFTTFGHPLEKFRKNPLLPSPLEKILPTPMILLGVLTSLSVVSCQDQQNMASSPHFIKLTAKF